LALDKLTQIANIEFEAKRYMGNYSPTKVSPRSLPTDSEIVEWYERLSNPAWQWAFGMLSTPQWDACGVHCELKVTQSEQVRIFDKADCRLLE
jgi:hypothetical protein